MNQSRKAFLVVVFLLVVAGFGFVLFNAKPQPEISNNANAPKLMVSYSFRGQAQNLELVQVSANALEGARFVTGAKNAPFTIVEFSDYECPACALFATEYESLFESKLVSSGKVRFAYRYPLHVAKQTETTTRAPIGCVTARERYFVVPHKNCSNGAVIGLNQNDSNGN